MRKIWITNTVFVLFVIFSLCLQTNDLPIEYQTIVGSFYNQFYGLSIEGFNLYKYLFVVITFFLPVMFFFNNLYTNIKGDIYYHLIRYLSFKVWFYKLLKGMVINILLTMSFLLICTYSLAFLKGYSFTGDYSFTTYELFYHFIANGFLQMLNYHFILLILICLSKKTEVILLSIGALIVLGLPLFNSRWIFPILLNSMGYITGGFHEPLHITFILGVYLLLEILIITVLLKRRLLS